jgi:methanogenic corrinoid protein MtbC1
MVGEAVKAALAVLEPEMIRRGSERKILGMVVIGTIEGNIHDIGKMLLSMMLSESGFKVIDLDVDLPDIDLVDRV